MSGNKKITGLHGQVFSKLAKGPGYFRAARREGDLNTRTVTAAVAKPASGSLDMEKSAFAFRLADHNPTINAYLFTVIEFSDEKYLSPSTVESPLPPDASVGTQHIVGWMGYEELLNKGTPVTIEGERFVQIPAESLHPAEPFIKSFVKVQQVPYLPE